MNAIWFVDGKLSSWSRELAELVSQAVDAQKPGVEPSRKENQESRG